MTRYYGSKYEIPGADDAIPLDSTIATLRKDISSTCAILLREAKKVSTINKRASMKLRSWEEEITVIKKDSFDTHNIEKLRDLRNRCEVISQQIRFFGNE